MALGFRRGLMYRPAIYFARPTGAQMQRIIFNAEGLAGDEIHRKDQWIEELSSGYVRLNADPVTDAPFRGELRIAALDQTAVGTIHGTVKSILRTPKEIAEEDADNLVLLCNGGQSPMRIAQNGAVVDLSEGASVLIEQSRPSQVLTPLGDCHLLALQAPRTSLRMRLPTAESQIMVPIAGYSTALGLAMGYANIFLENDINSWELVEFCASNHIADLIAAAITPERAESTEAGVRTARLRAIKDDILRHLASPSLSISDVAARQGISPAYIRKLFAASGTSFRDFVLAERLSRAHRMLRDPQLASRQIGAIAFDAGFSDLSYFNRTFRRSFGVTPSELRAGIKKDA